MLQFQRVFSTGAALTLSLLFCACTGIGQTVQERSPQAVSSQEIEQSGFSLDLYSLVQRIRPNWLRKSGPHSIMGGDDIRVYVNGMRYPTPSSLRYYHSTDVESMRFLEPGSATVRYGIGHSHGAIVVRLRGGGDPTT